MRHLKYTKLSFKNINILYLVVSTHITYNSIKIRKGMSVKKVFQITDKNIINKVLDKAEYGTLAVCNENKPYAVPLNFVRIEDTIYFHGALKNKKMKMLEKNPNVSFSVVESYSIIASFFSSTDGLACPATHFFKSVSIDGMAEVLQNREDKAMMFEAMMKKLQLEGGYKPFSDEAYSKSLKATAVVKIVPSTVSCKFKFGQHLDEERFDMILKHLKERDTKRDNETMKMMKGLKDIYSS